MDDGLKEYGDSKRKAHICKNCSAGTVEPKKTNSKGKQGVLNRPF
jgi:hypothetical protein